MQVARINTRVACAITVDSQHAAFVKLVEGKVGPSGIVATSWIWADEVDGSSQPIGDLVVEGHLVLRQGLWENFKLDPAGRLLRVCRAATAVGEEDQHEGREEESVHFFLGNTRHLQGAHRCSTMAGG